MKRLTSAASAISSSPSSSFLSSCNPTTASFIYSSYLCKRAPALALRLQCSALVPRANRFTAIASSRCDSHRQFSTAFNNSNSNSSGSSSSKSGSNSSNSNNALMDTYLSKVNKGLLTRDENQIKILKLLSQLSSNLSKYSRDRVDETKSDEAANAIKTVNDSAVLRMRGVYIFGTVGTGKTMMMDAFYESCQIKRKRRVHFHKFMLEIHNRIHGVKQELLSKYGKERHINLHEDANRDPIVQVARMIASEASLLCFDEFQVTDICDAMILTKLFGTLWDSGTVLVATSNRPPVELYMDGVNREYFLPFIERLEKECIVKLISSEKDYRLESSGLEQVSFVPINDETKQRLWSRFVEMILSSKKYRGPKLTPENLPYNNSSSNNTNNVVYKSEKIRVLDNRFIECSKANLDAKIAWFDFATLCEQDRGASDYQALCKSFNIIFLLGVPKMTVLNHDRARRFIIFIDEVYDAGVRLFWTAEESPARILQSLESSSVTASLGKLGADHSWANSNGSSENNSDTNGGDKYIPKETHHVQFQQRGEKKVTNEKWVSSFSVPSPSTYFSISAKEPNQNETDNNSNGNSNSNSNSASNSNNNSNSQFEKKDVHIRGENTDTHKVNYSVKVSPTREEELNILQGELASIQELSFAFKRASSRLVEISSEEYLSAWSQKYAIGDGDNNDGSK